MGWQPAENLFSDYLDVLRHLFFRKLIKFIYADASTNLILKDFVMSSAPNRPFPCAIENTKENMVLAFSRANNFNLKAKSLRKKTNNEVYASSHLILAIFSQEEIDTLANSIVYIKDVQSLLQCPNIDEHVSIEILQKFRKLNKNWYYKKNTSCI